MRTPTQIVSALSLLCIASLAQGQKKVLTPADWNTWRSITNPAISADGKWVAYTITPLVGDGELVVHSTTGATEYRVPRGYLSRPNNVPGGLRNAANANPEGEPTGPAISPAQITADDKYVVVQTELPQAEYEALTGRGRAGGAAANAAANRTSLAIVRLADGQVTSISNVRSFRLARSSGAWLMYVPGDSTSSDSTARGAGGAAGGGGGGRGRGGRGGGGGGGAPSARRAFGSPLVIRTLATGAEERLSDVLTYAIDDSAKVLGYTVVSRDSSKDGAFVRTMATGATSTLAVGNGDYKQLVLDRGATQVAFLSDRDNFGGVRPPYSLYYASLKGAGPAQAVIAPSAVPSGLHIADNAAVSFTRAGNALVVNLAPPYVDSVPADSLAGKAVYDFWHYKDPTLQPAQKLTAARDRSRSFEAMYFPAIKKLVSLADDSVPTIAVSDDARSGLATSRTRYMISSMWGDEGTDVYALDPTTGGRKLIREKISGAAQLSPDGKYITLFDRGHWYAYGTGTGRLVDLTGPLKGVHFEQETHDTPDEPPAWGIAGWTKGDKSLLLYDRWDIWEADPTGAKVPTMVTDSLGAKQHLVLRVSRAGSGRGGRGGGGGTGDDRGVIDPAQPLLLSATNWDTKASGFYREQMGSGKAPERVVMADAAFGAPIKAGDADEYLLTKSTYTDFPNLWVGSSLDHLTKISDANPQQKDYNWGSVELVHWHSADGFPLSGLLYKPENFDPSKKYPMITYYYEQLSQGLHSYVAPNGRNVVNITHYVSNGYLVFEPDIHYEVGYPGPSAVKSIVPGVEMLLARGYVDQKALGLQGHSWGGYQTLYLVTQSHMFAAAWAGAPVVDMFSAYGGIRWGSGLARAFQYEGGQSRIGKSIWDGPQLYMENSPLFWLDRITTPLFVLADDADDAVPWYQGIELFVAMRRLGKEVYLIDYNNDVHNPAGRANQIDAALKMQQFFDTKLKGAPAPDWMVHGIPYLAKGKDQLNKGAPAPVQAGQTQPQSEKP